MTFVATWSDERVEWLKRLWADGLSCSQIAARMGGITRNAVIGKANRLGLPGRSSRGVHSSKARNRTGNYSGRQSALKSRTTRMERSALGQNAWRPRNENGRGKPSDAGLFKSEPYKPAVLPVIPEHERKSLIDLEDNDCRWPCTDGPPHAFCARPKVPGLVYCADHARVAYTPARMPHTPIYAGRLTAHYDLHIVTPREKEDA